MFWWLAQNTLLAGLLALAAGLAGRMGRLSPAVRHALWLVVLVKLITPPVTFYSLPEGEPWTAWLLSGPFDDAPRQAVSPSDPQLPGAETTIVERSVIEPSEDANEESVVEIWELPASAPEEALAIELEETTDASAPILLEEVDAEGLDLSPREHASSAATGPIAARRGNYAVVHSALVCIWALGAAWMGVLQAVRVARLQRLLRGAEAAPDSLTALVEELAAQLGVATPRVLLTSAACSPMIFAWGRVRLVWPKSLAEPFDGDARRAVIAHELAHLRRRDHWVGWLELAASCGWWWNPLFWYVRRQLRETAELACDAWVLALLPGGRRAYAQALIEVSEMISWTAAPAPAVGMGASARHLFKRRLTMILRERVPCRAPLVGLALIGLLGIAVLPGWTKGQAPNDAEIKRLEVRLAALANELRALRSTKVGEERPEEHVHKIVAGNPTAIHSRPAASKLVAKRHTVFVGEGEVAVGESRYMVDADVETLTRAKYKLPAGRAAALAAFIKEHVKEDVETKVDGDTLVVTAASDDQARIAQFVQLLKTTAVIMEEAVPATPQGQAAPASDPFSFSAVPPQTDLSAPDPEPAASPRGVLPRR
ncbi:MAG TPA: M56 family metallopeptidase [Pirellulales bacterium]|nr:M56 family metallopeptidase [Pirellulales bacterium]